ncbi:glycosyltransferase family 4 protein [Halosimplex rubrum]|uniref:Glycosyltransferase family 4 protein n=1 Tax=Halosimplex rubrum TaxID=869889 RepID=A0A7D5T4F2_9EURY|nr:glycosyltransferase family 4 protein [Halosimplex rubrum]QLH76853.1 glycosyltransferase family 4 protein [Halosimplex rubrum]
MTDDHRGAAGTGSKASEATPRSLRILRVAQKVYPDVAGGGAYHVHALSRDQAAMGHDVTVLAVAPDGDGDRPHVEQRDGYTVVRYPPTAEPLGNAVSAGVAQFLRRTDEYDVVHAHSHLYFSTNLAALARRLSGTPLAVTNHGLYSQTAPKWVFDAYLRTVGRWTFDSADVAFCYTDEDRDRLRDLGVSVPVEVVANGIDTARFTPDGPRSDDLAGDPAILFVGRLVDGKRPGDALAAFERLRERAPNAGLTICGDGPLREKLEERVRDRGLDEAVRFLGHLSYETMPAVYRAADALVLPSEAEGLPRTVLEAMATDVPVVTSALDQLTGVVDGGGETVPVGDVDRFADALAAVTEERAAYSPRAVVEDGYDWATTVEQTTEQFQRIAAGR